MIENMQNMGFLAWYLLGVLAMTPIALSDQPDYMKTTVTGLLLRFIVLGFSWVAWIFFMGIVIYNRVVEYKGRRH